MSAKVGRPALPVGERRTDGRRVPVWFLTDEHLAFEAACDGRPMAAVLRGLAAEFVARGGGSSAHADRWLCQMTGEDISKWIDGADIGLEGMRADEFVRMMIDNRPRGTTWNDLHRSGVDVLSYINEKFPASDDGGGA